MTSMANGIEILSKKEAALVKAGATREAAYRAYVEGLTATTVKYDRDGDCIGEHPDYATRIKAADSISRLNGDLKETPLVDNRVVNISGVSEEVINKLMGIVKDVDSQLKELRGSGRQTGEIIDVTVS